METVESSLSLNGPNPRIEIEKMERYTAPLEGRRELLRLDFNENTIGPSPLVLEAIRSLPADHISIYPEYNGLKEAIVDSLNTCKSNTKLSPNQISLFNGVDAAIHAIFHAYGDRGEQLLTTKPTFGYYKSCADMQGMESILLPYESREFLFPFQKIKQFLIEKSPKILLICNPNNPTGTRLAATKVLELASNAPNTLIVIDELYEAFSKDSALHIADFSELSNLIILRSFSKVAGLAGLRIGFAIGNHNTMDLISRVAGPYDINSFAVTAAFAALKDQKHIDNYVDEVLLARDWIVEQLQKSGIRYHIDGGNYFLLWPRRNPSEIDSCLRAEGILVRDMSNKPLIEGALRVSIGTRTQMKQFWEVFLKYEHLS